MLGQDIKDARVAASLSISEVARLADVPRKQVYAVESGGNVTLDTLRRIVAVIPNLSRLRLGNVDMLTAPFDLEEARLAALDLFDVAKRLMSALGAIPPARQPMAVHHRSGSETERVTAQHLEKMVEEEEHERRRSDS